MTDADPEDRPVFDPREWEIVRRAVRAIYYGDTERFGRELGALGKVTEYADRSVAYINFALLYQSAKLVQEVPTQTDLQGLAADANPRYARYAQPGTATLIEILETVWNLRRPHAGTKGNMLVVLGCVALAALIDELPADLDEIETELRAWINDSAGRLATILSRIERDRA